MTKFEELLNCITQRHVYIQPHNYPDQDALACAFGLSYLLSVKGVDSTICYNGQIDKLNTLTMMKSLNMKLIPISEIEDMSEQSEIIIVDGQKGNVNVTDFIGDEIACIDHHKKQNLDQYRFADVRIVGACSSIIALYYIENDIEIPEDVATALFYGIKMDTNNLNRGVCDLDLDMYMKLYKIANQQQIRKFDSSTLQMEDLRAYATAIENLKIYGKVGIVDIGYECPEAILGTMSDFILSLAEVTFSVVYSRRVGGIKFSVRSEDPVLDAADVIQTALVGLGSGGGHATMAAGFIPDVDTDEQAYNMSHEVESRIVDCVTEQIRAIKDGQ